MIEKYIEKFIVKQLLEYQTSNSQDGSNMLLDGQQP